MTLYSAEGLDLSRVDPAPLVQVDFEATLTARLDLLAELWAAARLRNPSLPELDTLLLESEPAVILNEEFAYGELLILQAINDAAKQLRLAQAGGAKLEHLAATYHRTTRRLLRAATAESPALYESDEELRARAQIAPEALADMALTPGGYLYKVRTAFGDRIKDVRPIRRAGGNIDLRLLGRSGDGSVQNNLIAEVVRAFEPEGASQSTDILSVHPAVITPIPVSVRLLLPRGPDPQTVVADARRRLEVFRDQVHRIGAAVYREAIASAAHVGPVVTVFVDSPAADVVGVPERAPWLAAINIAAELQ